jgi:hypothetical protein
LIDIKSLLYSVDHRNCNKTLALRSIYKVNLTQNKQVKHNTTRIIITYWSTDWIHCQRAS